LLLAPMSEEPTATKCSTSNCDNKVTHNSGGQLVCGSCLHGMMIWPEPHLMDEAARADARKLVTRWCANEMPAGWSLLRPGCNYLTADPCFAVMVTGDRIRVGRETVKIEAVEAAIASVTAGSTPGLVWTLEAALDDGDCLRGVIARAIQASDSIADSDAEEVIQVMLSILLEPEPEGHDDRIEWARMEGANAMLEVILQAGYGARGIADNRDALRKKVADLAVAATMPRNPEPEFENALLQREVELLRAQLDATREASMARANRLTDEWRAEVARVQSLLVAAERERDKWRWRIEVGEQEVDEADIGDLSSREDNPKIVAWMKANGFELRGGERLNPGPDPRHPGIWRGTSMVYEGRPTTSEDVVNALAFAVNRPALDVLAEIAAMVIE
jgi:hypothetical protein